jgi:hypothetical protein
MHGTYIHSDKSPTKNKTIEIITLGEVSQLIIFVRRSIKKLREKFVLMEDGNLLHSE